MSSRRYANFETISAYLTYIKLLKEQITTTNIILTSNKQPMLTLSTSLPTLPGIPLTSEQIHPTQLLPSDEHAPERGKQGIKASIPQRSNQKSSPIRQSVENMT